LAYSPRWRVPAGVCAIWKEKDENSRIFYRTEIREEDKSVKRKEKRN
jgi:hypothetical protein